MTNKVKEDYKEQFEEYNRIITGLFHSLKWYKENRSIPHLASQPTRNKDYFEMLGWVEQLKFYTTQLNNRERNKKNAWKNTQSMISPSTPRNQISPEIYKFLNHLAINEKK